MFSNSINNYSNSSNNGHDESFNDSYNTLASGANGASSSKAVLAALRALQDKIRRLEAERSQALDETVQLRHQLKNQEIEADHIKQKENLTAQKSLHEVRQSYDRLLTEKNELETRLARLDDRNRSSQDVSEELQSKIRSLEEQKHASSLQIKDLEHQHSQMELQISHAKQKEKEIAQTMVWETKRHEDEISALHKRVQTLQTDLSRACQEKGHTDTKLLELDQLVSQLLAVNESLLHQLSGKPNFVSASSPVKKLKPKKVKSVVVPRAASVTTAATEAGKTSKFVARQHSQLIPVKTDDIEQLRSMHKMYANMAKSIAKGPGSSAHKTTKHTTMSSDGASVGSVKSSNSLNSSTKKNKAATRLSNKKAELIKRFSEDARASQSLKSTSTGDGDYGFSSTVDVRLPKPAVSFDYANGLQSVNDSLDLDALRTDGIDGGGGSEERKQDFNSYFQGRPSSTSSTPVSHTNSFSASGNYASRSRQSNSASKAEIQNVIESLEDEFESLNLQYKRLLNNVHSPSTFMANSSSASGEANRASYGDQNIQAQAEEIVQVIQKLHKKGEQLRNLKSP